MTRRTPGSGARPDPSPSRRPATLVVLGLVAALTVTGFALRVARIDSAEGSLGEDQARLALAAHGVIDTGVPAMPSGRLYLRGVVSAYLTAASFLVFGSGDAAARVPNVVLGTLLVPLLFLFGRAAGGTAAGLWLAAIAAVQPDFVYWSADAWTTLPLVAVGLLAAWLLYLGYERDRPAWQAAGGVASLAAVLTHELGVLVPLSMFAHLALRGLRRDVAWFAGRLSALALALLAASVVLFALLGLQLRAGTVAGAGAEFATYFGPSLSLDGVRADLARWRPGYLPVLVAAVGGLVWLRRMPRSGGAFLYVLAGAASAAVWFVVSKRSERYSLILVPIFLLLAAWALARVGERLGRGRPARVLRVLLPVLVFGAALQQDARAVVRLPEPPARTWLDEIRPLGFAPEDLIFTDNPTIPRLYVGRADFWARQTAFARYSYQAADGLRDVYVGALRVATSADFEALVRAHAGRTLWYVGEEDEIGGRFEPEVWRRLFAAADLVRRAPDGIVLLRVDLGAPGLACADCPGLGRSEAGAAAPPAAGRPPFGWVDSPGAGERVGPVVSLRGWALDDTGVEEVRVYLDGALWLRLPLNELRPDVSAAHPDLSRRSDRHGWQATAPLPEGTRPGDHVIRVEAVDLAGQAAEIGRAVVRVGDGG